MLIRQVSALYSLILTPYKSISKLLTVLNQFKLMKIDRLKVVLGIDINLNLNLKLAK